MNQNIHFKNQSYLNEMNLSDEKSRRIASTILSMEPEKNGYFNYVNRLLNGLGVTTSGDTVGFYKAD